ncbi:hypothetical protein [Blastomonas sp. AAP53]|uniref:hypothetical protein n=1 Tax=Blastomonas sp. AAP53 TaxID=1248760 RepID=UPI001267756B|nr:hypothetical protein [Blastomonas sp. AAP53]
MAEEVAISSGILVERQITENGNSRAEWLAAETVVPGDTLKLVFDYQNQNNVALTNFVITCMVPPSVKAKAIDPDQLVSVDGGKTFDRLDRLTVAGPEGQPRAATLEDITNLRWIIPQIDIGAKGSIHYLGTVN